MKAVFLTSMLLFFRLSWRTFFQSKGTQARLTPKRFVVMALFLPLFFFIQLQHWLGFLLDELLFKDYRKVEVKKPLFIVGVPRSGTTFLHRVLANDSERFTTLTLWELLFAPSITERKCWLALAKLDRQIGRPFSRLLAFVEHLAFHKLDGIHRISLNIPEEDYFVLVPVFACFLLVLPFPFPEIWRLAYFDDKVSDAEKRRIMAFYKSCLQRHLYVRGTEKRILSKNVSFSPMIQALNETFPDCKVICNLRNPLQVFPSHLSSVMSGVQIFDNDVQGSVFRDRLMDLVRYSYRHLLTVLPEWPESRHCFVTMEAMKADLQRTVRGIYKQFDYSLSPLFEERLQEQQRRSRAYSSQHHYSLEQFDLQAETLREEFFEIFERFDFSPQTTISVPPESVKG